MTLDEAASEENAGAGLPPGYRWVRCEGVRAFARDDSAPWVHETLASGETLWTWASHRPGAAARSGRGPVWSVPAPGSTPDGGGRWIVRHYRRGGAIGPLLGDRYLRGGSPRPLRELRAGQAARARGLLPPSVVAGVVYPAGPFYRADLVTEEIPGAVDLAERLFGEPASPGTPEGEAALRAAAGLVRRFAEARILHPDLHAGNILLTATGAGVTARAVDFDRCRVLPTATPPPLHPMRHRLERSLRKLERKSGRRLPAKAWASLRESLDAS